MSTIRLFHTPYREDRDSNLDTLVPNQVLYQAELLPDLKAYAYPRGVEPLTA